MTVAERIVELEGEVIYLRRMIAAEDDSSIRNLAEGLIAKLVARIGSLKRGAA